MRPSPQRVASRYLARRLVAKIVVPPRRGQRGRIIFLKNFLPKLKRALPAFQRASDALRELSEWEAMFQDSEVPLEELMRIAKVITSNFESLQGGEKRFRESEEGSDRYYQSWNMVADLLRKHPLQSKLLETLSELMLKRTVPRRVSPQLEQRLEYIRHAQGLDPESLSQEDMRSLRDLFQGMGDPALADYFNDIWEDYDNLPSRKELLGLWEKETRWAQERAEKESNKGRGPGWNLEALSTRQQAILKGFVTQAAALKALLDEAKARVEAEELARRDRPEPPSSEKTEQLYHASVSARQLYQQGFAKEVPDQAGLGGSQSTRGRGKGTSFTYDFYVAKEIARSLKEMVMVAKGQIKASEIMDWARRDGVLERMVDFGSLVDPPYHFRKQDRTWIIEDQSTGKQVTPEKAFSTPVRAAWLFKHYLSAMGSAGKRYDPLIMNVGRVVPVLARVNPKNIGIVVVTVDMTNPDIQHVGHERELRVPPEAIVSVDRFIGG